MSRSGNWFKVLALSAETYWNLKKVSITLVHAIFKAQILVNLVRIAQVFGK